VLASCGGTKEQAAAKAEAPKTVFKWRLQSWAPAGDATYEAAEAFAARVKDASNGELIITPFTAGSIIPAGKEFDSVMSGSIEAVHGAPGWTIGYIPATVFFTQYPGGLTGNQMSMWMDFEGRELAQKLYGKLGVHYVNILTLSPAEVWAHTTKPLKSVKDIKGLKIRLGTTALNAIFSKMGAAPVFLPGGEIYESAKRGVIDGFEYITPSLNWGMGFHEVAKYLYLSPSRAPCDVQVLWVNQKIWDALPAHLQKIVDAVSNDVARKYYTTTVSRDADAIAKYEKFGTIVEKVPQDIIDLLNEKSAEYFKEESAKDADFKMIFEKHQAWQKICEQFDIK
jgi:TRAP-type mannitol/chloroaromatic compound transport system substrate-binding protein